MTEKWFRLLGYAIALGFTAVFIVIVGPALIEDRDVICGFAAGFVNPYASGYSADVFFCYFALLVWVLFERQHYGVRHGWACLLLGVVPGVATGFALYLVIRSKQLNTQRISNHRDLTL